MPSHFGFFSAAYFSMIPYLSNRLDIIGVVIGMKLSEFECIAP